MKKTPLFEMKTSIKLILIHLTVLSCVRCDEITVSGYEGGDAVINCPSQKGSESYPKYLQRGKYSVGVELIRSDGRSEWTRRGRVSLQDKKDRNIFTVTIHDLTLEDAGTYGCGVNKWGSDLYTQVNLNIVLSCVRCDEITVKGSVGGDAVINCPYQKGYESTPKYLLKGGYTDGVDVIRSNGRSEWTHSGRVSLQDKKDKEDKKDRNIFTVTIRNLTLEDAGTYGCGFERWLWNVYTIVNLIIVKKSKPQPAVITTATPGVTMATPATTSGHMAYLTGALIGALGLAGLLVVTFRLMKSRARRKRAAHSPSRHLSSARPVSGNSREETADYENDPQDPNTLRISSAYQSLNPNTTQPDAVYQSLNPNTTQPDAVYQSLNPNTIQPDAVYQSLNPNTTQPDAVYQSLNPNSTQPGAVYQSLNPNTTQPDAVYQSLNPNTT